MEDKENNQIILVIIIVAVLIFLFGGFGMIGYNNYGSYIVIDSQTIKWQYTHPMADDEGFKKRIKEENYQVVSNPRFLDSTGHQELIKELNA